MRWFQGLLRVAGRCSELQPVLFNFVPQRNLKFSADIKWVCPKREPVYHPGVSGDLELYQPPSGEEIRLEFQNSEKLKNASDSIKKIFSLEYLYPKHKFEIYEKQLIDRVKSNEYDTGSLEVKIAKCTAKIRYNQQYLLNPKITTKKKKPKIVQTKELIDFRKMLLRILSREDYKKFEWVLEQLNLVYKPLVKSDKTITRKRSLTLLAKLRVEKIKEEKLGALKKSLDEQKAPFLEKKVEKLRWIKEMEAKKGLPSSVTEEEINNCIKSIERVKIEVAERAKRGYIRKIHPYLIEAYDEKLLIEKEQAQVKDTSVSPS